MRTQLNFTEATTKIRGKGVGAAALLAASLLFSLSATAATTAFTATYKNGSGCGTTENINGQEPSATGTYPVFLYMVGTTESFTNASATAAVQGMANRGYVAATIQYPNSSFGSCSTIGGRAQCIFNPNSTSSAVSVLCSRAKADCSKGIVVGGFSQGAVIATLAKNFDSRVRAAYGMGDHVKYSSTDLSSCMANGNRTLPTSNLLSVTGEKDQFAGSNQTNVRNDQQSLTGLNCGSSATSCLNSNGSGWIIVTNGQVQDGSADHCYMRRSGDCFGSANSLDQGWSGGSANWELNHGLDWLTGFTSH